MDRLDAMTVLLAAVEDGSLSAASRRLGSPLATVSRKVAELEAHLNTQLVIRSSRRLSLTDAGRAYVASARQILEQVDEAERAAAGEYAAPRGDLAISAPVLFGRIHLTPIAATFLGAHPDIDLRLLLLDRPVNLLEEHIDLALRIGALADSSLIATRLGAVRRVVVASPDYLARAGEPLTPQDLADHACITFEGASAARSWRFGEDDVAVRSRLSVNQAEATIEAAIAGLGVTRALSYQAVQAIRDGRLKLLLQAYEPAPWPVSLIYPGQGRLALKVRAFLDWAAPRLRERLTEIAV